MFERQMTTLIRGLPDILGSGELPVEQPIKFELVINLNTARELGVTISREFLVLADDLVE